MDFGQAINALNDGLCVRRSGWNGKGLLVFRQVPSVITTEIIPKMQSLPESVKKILIERGQSIYYSNQLALLNPDNSINGWSPSVSDALANDWEIVN